MTTHDDDGERAPRLGVRFWIAWSLAATLVAGAFGALMFTHQSWALKYAPLGFLTLIWLLAMTPYAMMRMRRLAPPMRTPQRRYMARFLPAMALYTIVFVVAVSYARTAHPQGPLAWAVALAPVLPLLFAIRAVGLAVKEEDDEYVRTQTVNSYVWATNFTLTVCTVWGFLALFGLVPRLDLWVVFPIWAVGLVPPRVIGSWTK